MCYNYAFKIGCSLYVHTWKCLQNTLILTPFCASLRSVLKYTPREVDTSKHYCHGVCVNEMGVVVLKIGVAT